METTRINTHPTAMPCAGAAPRFVMCAAAAAASLLLLSSASLAQTTTPIKIGVLNDQSGITASLSGQGSVVAARMAVEDFGGSVGGRKVEVVYADHQYKPDLGSVIVRQWFDTGGVTALVDVPSSAVALAVQEVTRQANRVALFYSPAASQLTGKACSPNGNQWVQDTYGMANGASPELLRNGNDSCYFITIDYAHGTATEKDARDVIEAQRGKVVGAVRHAANAGDDMSNLVKQAAKFGVSGHKQIIAPLNVAGGAADPVIRTGHQSFAQSDPERWREMIDLNLVGTLNVTRAVVNTMIEQGSGSIVNVASIAGVIGGPNLTDYSAAKGGVIAFTKALAKELAPESLRVNSIAPGVVGTDRIHGWPQEVPDAYLIGIRLGRFAKAEEMATVILFLASSDASYVTGQNINVDGGWSMGPSNS